MSISNWNACGGCFDNPCTCGMYDYGREALSRALELRRPLTESAGQGPVEAEALSRSDLATHEHNQTLQALANAIAVDVHGHYLLSDRDKSAILWASLLTKGANQRFEVRARPTRVEPWNAGPVSREEFIEFVRAIAEGTPPIGDGRLVQGQRAIELAAWELYRRLQEAHEL